MKVKKPAVPIRTQGMLNMLDSIANGNTIISNIVFVLLSRLRSASRGYATNAWTVYSTGYLTSSGANGSYASLPACVIS